MNERKIKMLGVEIEHHEKRYKALTDEIDTMREQIAHHLKMIDMGNNGIERKYYRNKVYDVNNRLEELAEELLECLEHIKMVSQYLAEIKVETIEQQKG